MTLGDTELPGAHRANFAYEGNEMLTFTWPSPGQPRVLLIHGIGMGHWVYADFIACLRERTEAANGAPFEVAAVDLPGFGDCPEPQEARSLAETADLIALSIADEYAGSPYLVIGHSMGAQVATELAARHPNFVDRLVLIGATVNPEERTAKEQAMRMIQDLGNARVGVLVRGAVAYAKTGPNWFIEKLGPTLEHRIEDTLPQVTQPTLVLRGSEDPVSPRSWSERVASLIPAGSHAEIEGHGHEAIIADGDPAVREILAWLESLR